MKSINESQNNNVVYVSLSYESLRNIANLQTISISKDVMKKLPEEKITFVQLPQDKNTVNNNGNEISANDQQKEITNSIDLPQDGIHKPIKSQYQCKLCNQSFRKLALYKKHIDFHNNIKKYKCEHCYESYNVEDNLKLHKTLHTSSSKVCPLCNKKFQRLAGFKSHLLLHQVDETFTCKYCLAEFEKESDYREHLEKHSTITDESEEEEKLPYICSYCNYVFEDSTKFKEHISHHIKVKKLVFGPKRIRQKLTDCKDNPHKCTTCGKSFRKQCLLERHLRIHSGERPFACTKCDRKFTQKGSLQVHLIKHTGYKAFKCTLCPASFFQKSNLRVHVEKAHTAPNEETKVFKCKECTCVFKRICTLNAHITKVHTGAKQSLDDVQEVVRQLNDLQQLSGQTTVKTIDELISDGNEHFVKLSETCVDGSVKDYLVRQRIIRGVKSYLCLYCPKEFKKPSDLIRHIRVHTREKPYVCRICQTGFSLKSVLRAHMNTHLGKKEHQCLVCLQLFSSTKRLNKHLRTHENSEEALTLKYKCSSCDKLCNSLQSIEQHMEVHKCTISQDNERIEKTLPSLVELKQPILKSNSNLIELSPPKVFAPYLQDENSKKRPFKCHLCSGAFMKSDHLRSHMLSHSQEKNFSCDLCDKTFSTISNLNHHKSNHSMRKYECGICFKKFSKSSYLQSHQMQHVDAGNYMCPFCKKEFKSAQLCRKHIRTHKSAEVNLSIPLTTNLININTFQITKDQIGSEEVGSVELLNEELAGNIINEEITEGINNVTYSIAYPDETGLQSVVELAPITECNQNYSTIYISCNDQEIDTTGIFDPLSQTQIETSNTVLAETQDVNLLFIDPLSQQVALQEEDQNFGPFNQVLLNETVIPSEINLTTEDINLGMSGPIINDDVIQQNVLSNIVDIQNPRLKLNVVEDPLEIESNKDGLKQVPKLIVPVEHPNGLKENMYITITMDDLKANNLSYLSNMIGLNNVISEGTPVVEDLNLVATNNILITENENEESITCAVCCETIEDLANHACINVIHTEQEDMNQSMVIGEDEQEMMETQDNVNEVEEQVQNVSEECGIEEEAVDNDVIKIEKNEIIISEGQTGKKSNVCSFCLKEFRKLSDLKRHIRTHTGERPFKCEKCPKSFSLKSTLLSHMRTHDPGDSKITCHICNYSYSCKASLKVHMMIHSGIKPYQCHLCPARFRTAAHRRAHIDKHNQIKPKKKGTIKSDIKNVLNYTNNYFESILTDEREENVVDIPLNETTNNVININENAKVITPTTTIDPSETLTMNDSLHIDILQQLQQFGQQLVFDIDEIQEKTSIQPMIIDPLETNVEPVITATKEKTFGCDICGKMYSTKSILRKHQKNHKKFVCSKCRKQFDAEDELEKHMKIHMGYRPFSCLHCANSFSEEASLKTHMKRIHNLIS